MVSPPLREGNPSGIRLAPEPLQLRRRQHLFRCSRRGGRPRPIVAPWGSPRGSPEFCSTPPREKGCRTSATRSRSMANPTNRAGLTRTDPTPSSSHLPVGDLSHSPSRRRDTRREWRRSRWRRDPVATGPRDPENEYTRPALFSLVPH